MLHLLARNKQKLASRYYKAFIMSLPEKQKKFREDMIIPIRVTFDDIKQLHFRIEQMYESLNIQSHNLSITVYYDEDTREIYSSFERFSLLDQSSLSPVESIIFKYSFLIIPPKSKKPQNQTLTVQVVSRMTLFEKTNHGRMSPRLFKFGLIGLGSYTAIITVQYVDYVMARNLLDGVERWVKGLPNRPFPKWFTYIRDNSEYVRYLIIYSIGAFTAYHFVNFIPTFVPNQNANLQAVMQFGIIGSLSVFTVFRLGRFIGRRIEDALDVSMELSYIKLNRGDEKRIDVVQRRQRKTLTVGALSG